MGFVNVRSENIVMSNNNRQNCQIEKLHTDVAYCCVIATRKLDHVSLFLESKYSSTLIYIRLHSSRDSSTFVYTRLVTLEKIQMIPKFTPFLRRILAEYVDIRILNCECKHV